MTKFDKFLLIMASSLAVLFVISMVVMLIMFKELMNDYKCSSLPKSEFYKDATCERYWDTYE